MDYFISHGHFYFIPPQIPFLLQTPKEIRERERKREREREREQLEIVNIALKVSYIFWISSKPPGGGRGFVYLYPRKKLSFTHSLDTR